MAVRREKVVLAMPTVDEISAMTSSLRRAAEVSRTMFHDLDLAQATWEPHDWDDFQ